MTIGFEGFPCTARETLISKLNVIDDFYARAAEPFRRALTDFRKYEEDEMDPIEGPSPYEEIKKNEDFLNLLGQVCLCLMSTAIDNFLDDFALEKGLRFDPSQYPNKIKGRFNKFAKFYEDKLRIDFKN